MINGKEILKTKMRAVCVIAITAVLAGFSASAPCAGQDLIVYPSKGQGAEKMEQDKYSCYQWAKGQTGFDPMQAPTATAPPPQQKGGAARGAAGGAAAGAAAGAIAGNAGKGAAIGAASGGILGGLRRHRSQKAQDEYTQQQAAGYEKRRNDYNRAWGACMEGRGYTVR
jgi:hypothetical protein